MKHLSSSAHKGLFINHSVRKSDS